MKATIYYLFFLFISLSACQSKYQNIDTFYRAICINPDTTFATGIESLSEVDRAVVNISLNNYLNQRSWSDPRIQTVQRIKNHQENLEDFHKEDIPLNLTKVQDDQIEMELFVRLNTNSIIHKLYVEEVEIIKKVLKNKPKDFRSWYNQIRLLKILGKHYETIHETEKQYATYLYGLHLIESSKEPNSLRGLRDQLVHAISTPLTKEKNFKDYFQSEALLANLLSDESKNSFNGLMRKAYVEEELKNKKLLNTYFQTLKKAEIAAQSKADSMVIMLNLGIYHYFNRDSISSLEYFKKMIDLYPKPSCTMNYFQGLLSILDNPLPPEELDYYFKKFELYKQCEPTIIDNVSFIKYQYIDQENIRGTRVRKVEELIKNSELASKIFPGRSTLHIQDYYLTNLNSICELYKRGEAVEREIAKEIINHFLEVRNRDLHRQEIYRDPISGVTDKNNRKRISEILLHLNNFKELAPLDDPIYKELFQIYVLNEVVSRVPEYDKKEILLKELDVKLQDKCLLNFFRWKNDYIVYSYLDKEVRIWRFEKGTVDSLLLQGYDLFENKKEIDDETSYLFKELRSLTKDKEIIVVADGLLVNFPLNYLFNEANKIYQFSNVYDYVHHGEIVIEPEDINLISYSSEATIDDKSIKKYPELEHGLRECESISSVLKMDEEIISGEKFKLTNSTLSNSKLIHFSTHAKSNTNNRFDNYIITRDEDQKYYGFELYNAAKLPEVVVFSACETGIGFNKYGAGVQTLSRAFLDNGTQTVIKTLWKVNEKATAEFMPEMYRNWTSGATLYDALDMTKESFRTHPKYAHPYYWAGFVLEGNPNVRLDLSESK